MIVPPEQQAIRDRCFHPTGTFVEFEKHEIDESIAQRFERVAAKYPERLAVKTNHFTLTYEQLNETANRIARGILERCGGEQERIAIIIENEALIIAAILGALKAGKVYVPLDPSQPKTRLAYILKDCEAGLILTDSQNCTLSNDLSEGNVPWVDVDLLSAGKESGNLGLAISPDALTWIFYTSGSTGQPKGVVQTHRNVLHQIMTYTNGLHLCSEDRFTLLHSCSFSASRLDIFGALFNGASLFPFSAAAEGMSSLAQWLLHQEITIFHWVPTPFRNLVNALSGSANFPELRLVVLGSEILIPNDVELYKKLFTPNCVLVNRFGATETGNIRWYFIDKKTEVTGGAVPVGYGLEDIEVMLLDDDGKDVEVNDPGEIAVKGRYLSPGYWRQPTLTAAKFTKDQCQGDDRIYLTGDLGRMSDDGCLYHLGRKDSQVKVRGYRVDPGEVETALLQHNQVREVAVVGRKNQLGDARLVAYVVPAEKIRLNISELRRFLSHKVPEYMIPTSFIPLDRFPLTPSGKINHRLLPVPDRSRPEVETPMVAPRSEVEKTLVSIWEKILEVHPIGIHDNFFELGGNSLLAVRLFAKIENIFGKQLRPATLFEAPTIEQLAGILMGPDKASSWSALVPIQPNGSKPPFFWVHGDSSGAFLPKYLEPDQPIFGLEHQSQDGKPARYTSVESIAAHYLREIRSVQFQGPYYLGGYSFGSIVALEIAQQLKDQAQEVALLALLDPPRPFKTSDKASTRLSDSPTSINGFHSRLHRHYTNVNSLGYKKGIVYLWERVAGKISELRSNVSTKVSNGLKRALIKICLARGRDLPSSVRSRYILDLYHRIRPEYEMRRYSGRVVLFKGDDQSDEYVGDWDLYLVDEKQIYQVPGHHMGLREETYIRGWAEHLKACLEAAQVTDTP